MAFHSSPRFLESIAAGATGGPMFATDIVIVEGGKEKRNARWPYPQQMWDVSQGVKTEVQFEWLRAFFITKQGKAHGFPFKDFSDFEVALTEGIATGITSTTFQLAKRYSDGVQTLSRPIRKPLASGFVLKDTGVTLVLTTDYTLSTSTGIVTTTAPRTASNLTWSGQFDVPMRFDVDKFQGRIISKHPTLGFVYEWDQIPLVELLPGQDT